jgi:hypothetical protein
VVAFGACAVALVPSWAMLAAVLVACAPVVVAWRRPPPRARARTLARRDRIVLAWVLGSAGLMALGAFAPWIELGGHGSVWGLALPWHDVERHDGSGYEGWLVLAAALAGGAGALAVSRAAVGGAVALLAGMLGAVSAFDARDLPVCPGTPSNTLGLFCMQSSVGWGLDLAAIASLGLAGGGLVSLGVAAGRELAGQLTPVRARDRAL